MNVDAAFKLFDIRGRYPTEVDTQLAYAIGRSLFLLKRPKKVLVACDTRPSSQVLLKALTAGLTSLEATVVIDSLGVAPVTQLYYTARASGYDLGIMGTASHVSDKENGFKFVDGKGLPFDEQMVLDLKKSVKSITITKGSTPPSENRLDNVLEYIEKLAAVLPKHHYQSFVAIDVTQSSVVSAVQLLFQKLGISYEMITNGENGNPLLEENRRALMRQVRESQASFGIKWDSDGDRAIFVNNEGNLIPLSFVLGILGAYEVTLKEGKTVITDVRAGLVVHDLVHEAGGEVEVVPAWAQYIKFAMRDNPDVVFGGETSGHFVFKRFYSSDDGILAALTFLYLWEKENLGEKLTVLAKRYFELPETNFSCPNKKAPEVLEKITDFYRRTDDKISIVDGLTVIGPDFKFNLRASLTEPFLRLNLEARNKSQAETIISQIESHL